MSARNLTPRRPPTRFDGEAYWFSIDRAASLIGATAAKLDMRARAREFVFEADEDGNPCWFRKADIDALYAAKLQAQRSKAKRPPKAKTPAQQEAAWARLSAERAKNPRDGAMLGHHLRTTLPRPKDENPE